MKTSLHINEQGPMNRAKWDFTNFNRSLVFSVHSTANDPAVLNIKLVLFHLVDNKVRKKANFSCHFYQASNLYGFKGMQVHKKNLRMTTDLIWCFPVLYRTLDSVIID